MKQYYAFKPKDNQEPLGSDNKLLFKLKTDRGAIKKAQATLGVDCCVYSYYMFYDASSFEHVAGVDTLANCRG